MIDPKVISSYIDDNFNNEQADAVRVLKNCVVKAGAGSGKTWVLTYRFFHLVATGRAHVDEILTLTFTKAAAAEMYERIQKIFTQYSDDEDILSEMKNFQDATISTLDSFCYQIVQMDLSRFGLTPDFTLDPDDADSIATRIALRLLSEDSSSPALRYLSEIYSPDALVDSLITPLFSRFFWLSMPYDPISDASLVRAEVERLITDRIDTFKAVADTLWGYCDEVEEDKSAQKNMDSLEQLFPLLEENSSEHEIPKVYKVRRKLEVKEEYNELIDTYNELAKGMKEITILHSKKNDLLDEIYILFAKLHDEVSKVKRERQVLSYYDVAQMARSILLSNPQVRSSLSSSFRYIMVDEFQDTNELQKEILYLLSLQNPDEFTPPLKPEMLHPAKLFMVGDEKQSIYRFRGADVSVFRRLDREIIASGGIVLNLSRNYRSEHSLIGTFNSLFREILGEAEEEYEASHQNLNPQRESDTLPVRRELFIIEKDEEETEEKKSDEETEELRLVEREAIFLAEQIDRIINSGEYTIMKGGKHVSPTYDDIAILMRTYSPQLQFEKYFRMKGIPYVLSDVKSLHLEAVANDIYSMLQLLIFPDDLLAYTAVLRSPLCYIDDDALLIAVAEAKEHGIFCEIEWNDETTGKKYETIRNLYAELKAMSKKASLASLVSHIWYEGGYRYNLLSHDSYTVFIEHVEYLMELAVQEESDGGSLVTYTDRLRNIIENTEDTKGLSILSETTHGVHLMSIHKSKGLQFPIVIVGSCGSGSMQNRIPGLYLWNQEEMVIPVPYHDTIQRKGINLIWESEKKRMVQQDEAELKRLFYVACTRAESHLIFSGVNNRGNTDEKHRNENFLAMLLAVSPESHGIAVTVLPDSSLKVKLDTFKAQDIAHTLEAVKSWYDTPVQNREFGSRIIGVTSGEHEIPHDAPLLYPKLSSYGSDEILSRYGIHSEFGTWVHAMFEAVLSQSESLFRIDSSLLNPAFALSLKPMSLERTGMKVEEEESLAHDILTMVEGVLSSPFFESLNTQSLTAIESELEFMARITSDGESLAVNGIIDLLLRYEDHLTIVDFKTDAFQNPEVHEHQITMYASAMEKLYGVPVKSVLCYVRQPGMEVWLAE